MNGYQDLVVWQKSMQLVKEVYFLVRLLPKEEKYSLGDQMRRAAVSIPSNIAEGYGRNYDKELIQFLYISRGSKAELETQIKIGIMLNYFSEQQAETSLNLCSEVGKMINSFIATLKNSKQDKFTECFDKVLQFSQYYCIIILPIRNSSQGNWA